MEGRIKILRESYQFFPLIMGVGGAAWIKADGSMKNIYQNQVIVDSSLLTSTAYLDLE